MSTVPGTRMRALRGATSVPADDPTQIVDATVTLVRTMLDRNRVAVDDVVSLIFTSTADLTAEFPAAGARALGMADVPLLCATEIAVPGALPRCVRVLMHVYTDRAASDLRHVYLGDARSLRTDLPE